MSEGSEKYNRGGLIAFMFSMAFVMAFFVYIVAIHPGVDLQENVVDPKAPSTGPADILAQFDIASVKEPWVSSPELVEYGHRLFKANCLMCHGAEGKGDGPAGQGLNPKPRNFVEGKWTQGEGITSHFKVLQKGIAGGSMASFKHFKPSDRWAILQFIESITTNKSKEDAATIATFAKTAD